ncbi:MAG: hypothetical protein WDN46_13785 [Methylocella sp.]
MDEDFAVPAGHSTMFVCFMENAMPDFKLPLSGDVTQSFSWLTGFLSSIGDQFSLISVNMGKSSDPKVEEKVISEVASYGKQIGRIEDALAVLLDHFHPDRPLTHKEEKAIRDMKRMLEDIEDVKGRYSSKPSSQP